jgi:hypothetical protein
MYDHRYSHQYIQYRAAQPQEADRASYLECVTEIDARCLVFIDESHWAPDFPRLRGWGPMNKPLTMARVLGRGRSFSYLGACNFEGMLSCSQLLDTNEHGAEPRMVKVRSHLSADVLLVLFTSLRHSHVGPDAHASHPRGTATIPKDMRLFYTSASRLHGCF